MRRYVDDAPAGVVVYESAVDFTAEDSSRMSGFGIPGDAGGYDAIEPVLHEDGSQWRVSICTAPRMPCCVGTCTPTGTRSRGHCG